MLSKDARRGVSGYRWCEQHARDPDFVSFCLFLCFSFQVLVVERFWLLMIIVIDILELNKYGIKTCDIDAHSL